MLKNILIITLFVESLFGCVCDIPIKQAFSTMETTIILNHLQPINSSLNSYANAIQKNTDEIKNETAEYKKLIKNESILTLKLEELLFNIKKENEVQSIKNQIISENIQILLKQNEGIVIGEKKLIEKERY